LKDLSGKTALITGGSKGIGYGIAVAMIAQKMNVLITGRDSNAVNEAVDMLNSMEGGKAIGMAVDVRDPEAQNQSVAKILEEWGTLDVLIANAGLGIFGSIEDITLEQWNQVIETNLTGVFNSIKASLPALKKSKGYIITIASLAGTNFFAGGSAYNASKFGLVGFTQAVMLDLRQQGIKVSTIMPGSVSTYFRNNQPNENDDWKIQIEDIGQMVIDLLYMHPRTLPSKIEVRPTKPPVK
jgi:NAD(P)-dependent dehydrogenase (short-subunit alcohol dehydrogenase family)